MCYSRVVWTVVFHPEAEAELDALPVSERVATLHAVEKLEALGPALPFPHQSNVKGTEGLRELRPRAGRSQWRALYGRAQDTFVVVAIAPEALVDARQFRRAVAAASKRMNEIED